MRLVFNIQLFADTATKTEKATPRKRQEARKRGMVAKSREVTSAFALLISVLFLKFGYSLFVHPLQSYGKYFFGNLNYNIEDIADASRLFSAIITITLKLVLPFCIVIMFMTALVEWAQSGFLITSESLKVSFQKINPIEGFKRIFSINSVVELIKSILKILIIGYTGYLSTKTFAGKLLEMYDMSLISIVKFSFDSTINLILWMSIMFFGIAVIDFIFQRQQYEKKLMMTKEEVKEEFKQTEGNPQIKSRIRERQRRISLQRMFQQLPKADVVITNPTHYAVALLYEPEKFDAPRVIAKGKDYIAQKIKEEAKKYKIEIVENKELAQSLYNMCEVGDFIPPELYHAVAEVLAYVYSLKNYQKVNMR
ncbi:flagellar biosynthetic protein FlhB [Caldicellulosiruptor saccharolyticus DSM 8903]|uniref:Flagellar biosynthetic protein FlhB n=1 Tax=Caldicellulosiruptor saccharolyticus (strain ATCC 43494 / DSM 8903 / Tp8T 6331) TaxID=351627 RepID=A4XIZ4_CALS8|nr:flagellar biosynthesis protein FlhB [Caldicellulosiruptor saccharolyticus]ABP66879.1 flagellar biosynthetic protein FlhB [Caldicellulosiruptor saccharolyticus DSM 8903]